VQSPRRNAGEGVSSKRSSLLQVASERRRHSSLHVIARRRSRRGNPEVLFSSWGMRHTSSQRMELDCRVGCASSQ